MAKEYIKKKLSPRSLDETGDEFRPEKIMLSPEEERLLRSQTGVKIGLEDMRVALECVRIVQAGYQNRINESIETGDAHHVKFYKLKRDRLVRWMQDYTSLIAEKNCRPEGTSSGKKGIKNDKKQR